MLDDQDGFLWLLGWRRDLSQKRAGLSDPGGAISV